MTSVRTGPGSAFGPRKAALQCLFAALALCGMPTFADSVSVGTRLEIRLEQPISSYSTLKGTKISGVLIAPVTEGGDMLLPRNYRGRYGAGGQKSRCWRRP